MAIKTTSTVSTRTKAFKLEGVPQLIKTVRALGDTMSGKTKGAFDDRVREAMLKPAQMMADEARDMCPVVTGALRDSIKAMKLVRTVGALVFTEGLRYAAWVEFGTSQAQAHPYFRPAMNAVRPLAANVLAEELSKVVEGVAKENAWSQKDAA